MNENWQLFFIGGITESSYKFIFFFISDKIQFITSEYT